MAKAQLEIVMVDDGASAEEVARRAAAAPAPAPTARAEDLRGPASTRVAAPAATGGGATPAGSSTKPGDEAKPSATPAHDLLNSALSLSRALGVGGLLSQVQSVGKAMQDICNSASKLFGPSKSDTSVPAATARLPSVPAASSPVSVPTANRGNVSDDLFAIRPASVRIPAPPRVPPVAGGATAAARGAATAVPAATAAAPAAAGGAETAIAAAAGHLAGVAAAAGPAAVAIAGVAVAAVGAAVAAKMMADVMHDQAQKLADYSPELSNQAAQTDLRAELAEIRRAQRVGPGLANFENDRSRAMTALADIGTNMLSVLTSMYDLARPGIQNIITALELMAAGGEITSETLRGILDWLTGQPWDDNLERVQKAATRIAGILEGNEEPDWADDPFFEGLLKDADGKALGEGRWKEFLRRPVAQLSA